MSLQDRSIIEISNNFNFLLFQSNQMKIYRAQTNNWINNNLNGISRKTLINNKINFNNSQLKLNLIRRKNLIAETQTIIF